MTADRGESGPARNEESAEATDRDRPSLGFDDRVALIAHEIRGPLHALGINLDVVLEGLLDPPESAKPGAQRVAMQRLRRILHRMQRLADELLTDYRMRSDALELRLAKVDLCDVVLEALRLEDDTRWPKSARYSLDAPSPVVGYWDPLLLQIAVGNLLGNAIKYGGDERIEINVSAASGFASVAVLDHGRGVAEPDRAVIFERFRRGSAGSAAPGTGLGLWLASNIAQAHGGELYLRDTPHGGACFVLSIPQLDRSRRGPLYSSGILPKGVRRPDEGGKSLRDP